MRKRRTPRAPRFRLGDGTLIYKPPRRPIVIEFKRGPKRAPAEIDALLTEWFLERLGISDE